MQKFELKLRSEDGGDKKKYSPAQGGKKSKGSLRAVICLGLTLGVIALKMSSASYAGGLLSKVEYILTAQTDFYSVAENVVASIDGVVSKVLGSDVPASSSKEVKFVLPLKNGKLSSGFEQKVHPVFNTLVEPTGIVLSAEGADFVYGAAEGTISSISKNADSSYRVVLKVSRSLSVIYDNLAIVYYDEGEAVPSGKIIGVLSEENPSLTLEVYSGGEAVDPANYFEGLKSLEENSADET